MAAQHSQPQRLLMLAEQTADWAAHQSAKTVSLPALKTADGRVSFQPVLFCPARCRYVALKLKSCIATVRTVVQCKMTGVLSRPVVTSSSEEDSSDSDLSVPKRDNSKTDPSTLTAKSRVVLRNHSEMDSVVRLDSFDLTTVTVQFTVYDDQQAQPNAAPGGAGLHLNQARLQGTFCDVKLVVEGVELPAHRTVLAVRSPVLSSMLTGDFKEAREGRAEMVDSCRATVEKFLEFLYTDHIEDWGDSEVDLLQMADKFLVPELRNECCKRLWFCEPLLAVKMLHAAGMMDTIGSALRQRLTAIVVNNLQTLTSSEEWAEFKADYPALVDSILGAAGAQLRTSTSFFWDSSVKW